MSDAPLILPSIMCEKPWEMRDYVSAFERGNVAAIHFDVMDGHYVPNVMLGVDDFDAVHSLTSLPVDLHIIATNPDDMLKIFRLREGDWCSFHPEVALQPYRLLDSLREKHVRAGLALSPGVPVGYVEECLDLLDFVLVMAVSPGFAGQKMVPDHLQKLRRIKMIVEKADHPIDIIIDGNTTPENARKMIASGATGLVVGTSSLLKEGPEGFERLQKEYLASIAA